MNKEEKAITRRQCICAGAAAITAATGAAGCSMVPKPAQPSSIQPPWPYPAFDVEQVRRQAYAYKYEKACMYGVIKAIAVSAAGSYPNPWSTLPCEAFHYGRGGAYGWGTLCGALNGGLFVLTLALGNCPKAADDLIRWYTQTPLPSRKSESFCRVHNQPRSVAGSPLCHQSVANWIAASGNGVHTPERIDRCAKISGDTAARVAEILNSVREGTYKPEGVFPYAVTDCRGCHFGSETVRDDSISKMQCLDCHDDHRE